MKLAVIPARGGSKRIPRKNIKEFCGKPMVAWSILAAKGSQAFDRIVVSTDDAEIAGIARAYGAEVPFLRPAALSDDLTSTAPVVVHAIDWYQKRSVSFDTICCIYATAPFIRESDIVRGEMILAESGADFAVSVTTFAHPVQRAMRLRVNGRLELFDSSQYQTRSQDLPEAYHDAGQFYWGTLDAWESGAPILGPNSAAVILPRFRVQDIDTPEDWQQAEALMKAIEQQCDANSFPG